MHSVPATAQASIPIKIMMMPNATDFLHKATTAQATEATPSKIPAAPSTVPGTSPRPEAAATQGNDTAPTTQIQAAHFTAWGHCSTTG